MVSCANRRWQILNIFCIEYFNLEYLDPTYHSLYLQYKKKRQHRRRVGRHYFAAVQCGKTGGWSQKVFVQFNPNHMMDAQKRRPLLCHKTQTEPIG